MKPLTLALLLLPALAHAECSDDHRRLDFWIGDWDTFESAEPTGAVIARAQVESIAGGCAIRERYEQHDGLIGEAILSFDPVHRRWQQTWVTNRGALMVLHGRFDGDALVLEGDSHGADGKATRMRITWETHGDEVREWALMSRDAGATWSPAFDVRFRARAALTSN